MIHLGDCIEVMKSFPENSIDAVVTDPPYELSNDGKASASRVFLEVMFPQVADLDPKTSTKNELPMLIDKILGLDRVGRIPCPATAVEVGAVALDGEATPRDKDVQNGDEPTAIASDGKGRDNVVADGANHLGDFFLEFTDASTVLDSLNRTGCCFHSGGFGVGFRVEATSLPSLFSCGDSVVDGDHPVGTINDALARFVGALGATENEAMPTFNMGRGADNRLPACAALKLLAAIELSGSKIVRAPARAGRLSAKLQAVCICVVGPSASRTFSFNLLSHEFIIHGKGFMGKAWDGSKIAYDVAMWREVLRVLKPGGHLLAFGGTRTYHRMACAIEDAGFEIRDQMQWLYGSGFPKSLDVSKAIDKANGDRRPVVGVSVHFSPGRSVDNFGAGGEGSTGQRDRSITSAASAASAAWDGWGTALKPANEPICMARKPLSEKTVVANVLKWGTGALNIDASRIGYESNLNPATNPLYRKNAGYKNNNAADSGSASYSLKDGSGERNPNTLGRWPANVILDEESARLLDEQSGDLTSGAMSGEYAGNTGKTACFGEFGLAPRDIEANSGGASRFFYCAKPSTAERERGTEERERKPLAQGNQAQAEVKRGNLEHGGDSGMNTVKMRGNIHPTVKPVDLMAYLIKLVNPPGGTVLDPFLGSGTTAIAAETLMVKWVGIELSAEYAAIAEARIAAETQQGKLL